MVCPCSQVHILSPFIMNGVCVQWKGRINLEKLDGIGCLEFDEERAMVRTHIELVFFSPPPPIVFYDDDDTSVRVGYTRLFVTMILNYSFVCSRLLWWLRPRWFFIARRHFSFFFSKLLSVSGDISTEADIFYNLIETADGLYFIARKTYTKRRAVFFCRSKHVEKSQNHYRGIILNATTVIRCVTRVTSEAVHSYVSLTLSPEMLASLPTFDSGESATEDCLHAHNETWVPLAYDFCFLFSRHIPRVTV